VIFSKISLFVPFELILSFNRINTYYSFRQNALHGRYGYLSLRRGAKIEPELISLIKTIAYDFFIIIADGFCINIRQFGIGNAYQVILYSYSLKGSTHMETLPQAKSLDSGLILIQTDRKSLIKQMDMKRQPLSMSS
jgi:hypothetical protein